MIRSLLAQTGVDAELIDEVILGQALTAQGLSVAKELGWSLDKVNVNGGAIALGHPIGAKKGLATLCIGGGQGVAPAVERD